MAVGDLGCDCNCVYSVFLRRCSTLNSCTDFQVPVTHLKAAHTGGGPGKQADTCSVAWLLLFILVRKTENLPAYPSELEPDWRRPVSLSSFSPSFQGRPGLSDLRWCRKQSPVTKV